MTELYYPVHPRSTPAGPAAPGDDTDHDGRLVTLADLAAATDPQVVEFVVGCGRHHTDDAGAAFWTYAVATDLVELAAAARGEGGAR